jgi:hypothetical protein
LAFFNGLLNNAWILYYYEQSWEKDGLDIGKKLVLFIFGVILCVITSIILFLQILKRYSIITKYARAKYVENTTGLEGFIKKVPDYLVYMWDSFMSLLFDFDTIYYFLYLFFAILGNPLPANKIHLK